MNNTNASDFQKEFDDINAEYQEFLKKFTDWMVEVKKELPPEEYTKFKQEALRLGIGTSTKESA
tara:strand:+ start:69 stop:260 length:192 start_codon:yes stop_codon:yes gene_type:complete